MGCVTCCDAWSASYAEDGYVGRSHEENWVAGEGVASCCLVPPLALSVVSQTSPSFVALRSWFGEVVATSGKWGVGVTRAVEKVFFDKVISEVAVSDVAFVAACDSRAESVVRADVRPLVTPSMANCGVVAVSKVVCGDVTPILAEANLAY